MNVSVVRKAEGAGCNTRVIEWSKEEKPEPERQPYRGKGKDSQAELRPRDSGLKIIYGMATFARRRHAYNEMLKNGVPLSAQTVKAHTCVACEHKSKGRRQTFQLYSKPGISFHGTAEQF